MSVAVELAHEEIGGPSATRKAMFLHGILGSGQNLRTIARRFVEARPDFVASLVDLRGHGASPKRSPDPTLEAAAGDVVALASRSPQPVAALIGHSFGGKVALEAARQGIAGGRLAHVITIDSVPGAREPQRGVDSALAIIDTLDTLPPTFETKTAFVDAMVATGRPRAIAQWLALSLERDGRAVRVALDPAEVRALVLDYFARDLWPVVERPPGSAKVHLVIGDRSSSYGAEDRARAHALAGDRVTVDVLPTDHWVHAEDPDGLLRVMLERCPA